MSESAGISSNQLASAARANTLQNIQAELPRPYKIMSRVVHTPAIEKLSDGLSASLARTSGLLSGSMLALTINVLLLIFTRYYGFEYNYTLGVLGFITGYAIGLVVELIFRPRR